MEIFKVTMMRKKVIIQHNFMKFNIDNDLKIALFCTVSIYYSMFYVLIL